MRGWLGIAAGAALWAGTAAAEIAPEEVLAVNTRLMLELVRHTPTYSPPVASRTFAYVGVAAFEAVAGGDPRLRSLAGQLNGLGPVPAREAGATYDEAVVLEATLSAMLDALFANTGPTGQRSLDGLSARLAGQAAAGVDGEVAARSAAHGAAVAAHVLTWAAADGGATVDNMGFPREWELPTGPGAWAPTSRIVQQQLPLLPEWGNLRTFAMPDGAACPIADPIPYDEAEGSPFRLAAEEVRARRGALTDEERAVARFWSDDPMLSPTPPGHWVSIAQQVLDARGAPLDLRVEVMATLGVALADAFIGCWHEKYRFGTIRPVTYIKAVLDPAWEPLLTTPPFPEYPSGHSTQSAAAAVVLSDLLGAATPFTDATHEADGLAPRGYASFEAAAEEAALSRLLGGIHFRQAIEEGLAQGRCVGAHAAALETRS